MARDKSNLAQLFYQFLVRQAASDIKKQYEEIHKQHADDFFIEINLQKRRKGRSLEHNEPAISDKLEEFAKKYEIIPLHSN